ncbi:hypothetical protein L3Q82_006717 [Scortum barcoo]|uniref:Uncharacterized protein n=1 Tax=Scortum barcoo TaxID=214431 RepID=A0ACB8WWL0_9TELE|nr:hypothetical protein L3Q82_006717 [Scortum barcoo]
MSQMDIESRVDHVLCLHCPRQVVDARSLVPVMAWQPQADTLVDTGSKGQTPPLSPVHRRDCGGSGLQLQAHQHLYFLRRLRRAGLGSSVLTSFYRCVVESVLSSCIIVWHGSCSAAEKKALQRVVKAAQRTVGRSLPTTTDIYTSRCRKRASCIMKDPTHTAHANCLSPSPQAGGCGALRAGPPD